METGKGKNQRHSIRNRILTACLSIALGTTIVSLYISYYAELNTIRSTTERYMTQYISYADQDFNDMLKEAMKISLSVVADRSILYPALVNKKGEASYEGYLQRQQIRSFLAGLITQKTYMKSVMVVTQDQSIYQSGTEFLRKQDMQEGLMGEAVLVDKTKLLFDREKGDVLLCRPFYYASEKKAVCIVRLNYPVLSAAYEQEPLKDVSIYIYSGGDTLFYTNDESMQIKETEERAKLIFQKIGAQKEDTGYLSLEGEKQYYIRYSSIGGSTTAISLIPYEKLMKDADELKNRFYLIGICAVAVAAVVSVFLSHKLCKNIRNLTLNMKEVRGGNLCIRAQTDSLDEIGDLAENFNHMMDRINQLMEEVRDKEKAKREAEQSVLATQIEPHFLYNSIDSIQHVAHMRKEQEIERVAAALSELLRSVLTNCDEFITLWEEKEYIENYIMIERFKYREDFVISFDVDEELWTYRIPKLLLQPIVENALLHGIATKGNNGMITVKIYREEEMIVFKIMDNGKGIRQEKVEQLLSDIKKMDKTGFRRVGIANVFNRIRLIYGEKYGGTIYSCENMFTCVELKLPAEKRSYEDGNDRIVGG